MVEALQTRHLLHSFRGEPALDMDALTATLVGLGRLAAERPDIHSVDLNPLIVVEGKPVAVDALVELGPPASLPPPPPARSPEEILDRFRPLFHPRGIVVTGASRHPGKFGFVSLHNLRRFGYEGDIFPVNRDGAEILDRTDLSGHCRDSARRADLAFVCTPAGANVGLLRDCAKSGSGRRLWPAVATARPGRRDASSKTNWWRLPTSWASCWPDPTGRG